MNDSVINVLIDECGRYERTGIAVVGTLLVDKLYEIDAYPAAGLKKDVEQDSEIRRQQNVDKQHDAELKKTKILAWLGLGIAIAVLIVAVIALIL